MDIRKVLNEYKDYTKNTLPYDVEFDEMVMDIGNNINRKRVIEVGTPYTIIGVHDNPDKSVSFVIQSEINGVKYQTEISEDSREEARRDG